jgi:acyl carrier protein
MLAAHPPGGTTMEASEIAERVVKIIAESCGLPAEDITSSKTLVDELGMDSLDVADLVVQIEIEFEIEIPYSDSDDVKTVQDVVDSVKRHVEAKTK